MNTKKIKILTQFNCQDFPLDDTAIEVPISVLEQIGITKCFDVKNNCVIDYDGTKDIAQKQVIKQIELLKSNLIATDYQAIKHSEGLISDDDYAPIKAQRQAWRDEINRLEQEQ